MTEMFDEKKIEKGVKEARERMDKGMKDAREGFDHNWEKMGDKYDKTAKMVGAKEEEVAEKIKENPLTWVAGAFIAGMILGRLFSRK